jgi:hypothetical protein
MTGASRVNNATNPCAEVSGKCSATSNEIARSKIESEGRREIRYHEAVVWDEQPFARHVISVDAEDVVDLRPQTGREPHSDTTADIH